MSDRSIPASPLWRYSAAMAVVFTLGIVMGWPVVLTLKDGLSVDSVPSLRHIIAVVEDPVLLHGLANSFIIAFATTALCCFIAIPLAMIAAKFEFPGKPLLS